MTEQVKHLVDEVVELTGASPPAMLDADAPVLESRAGGSIYLIGLVGGKDVGKSSLVNAIVGQTITAPTSHGPGTETAIAYAHSSVADQLRQTLSREAPGRFTIITHDLDHLRQQVLLDLPDIDSKYADHVQLTRRMLRHMLYPLWIQSIEKYADRRPQELLAAVAEGNDPSNFIFCLNKADQVQASQAEEIRRDYSARIARAIGLSATPQVHLISAKHPRQFDLPGLRELLSRSKGEKTVERSLRAAQRRQDRSLFNWLDLQRLPQLAEQMGRLARDADEQVTMRVALPILDRAIPKMLDDPAQRMSMLAPAMRLRLSRWPFINALDALLAPVLLLVQKNLSASATLSTDPDVYLDGPSSISYSIQAAFARLQQLHPKIQQLYSDRKLWEPMPADLAAADLKRRFADAIDRQKQTILHRAAGRFGFILAPFRWLLTIGALLWFPFIQPILSAMLAENTWDFSRQTLRIIVDALSVAHLLQVTTFLLIWFVVLWMLLRWCTQRRVSRMIDRWKNTPADNDESLAGQTALWIDELLGPIHRQQEKLESTLGQMEELRKSLNGDLSAPAAFEPALNRD